MFRPLVMLLAMAVVVAACARDDEPLPSPTENAETIEAPPPAPAVPEPEPQEAPRASEPEGDVDDRPRSPLTGRPIDEALLRLPLLQVKIENSPQARPQSGLEVADVVFEELVEGGVTRFFVLFHSHLPEVAGPVRSARPVDTQLMHANGRAGFAYSGARAEVRALLRETPSITITEGGVGFYRDSSRRAPHNLYLDTTLTHESLIARDADPVDDVGWVFDETPPRGAVRCGQPGPCDLGTSMTVAMSRSFVTGWEYDEDAELYRRLQNGQPFLVTGPDAIGAANVVVLGTRHYTGASGYPETDLITQDAPAVVLRDGNRYEIRWRKPDREANITLSRPDGTPFALKPGPTWVLMPDVSALPAVGD